MQVLKKYWLAVVIAVLLVIAGGMIYKKLHPQTLPSNLVEGTGRMDGDLVNLNAKYAGRLEKIFVDDGVAVTKGMVIGVLKSKEFEAQYAQLAAQLQAQQQQLDAQKIEENISQTMIPLLLKKAQAQLVSAKASQKSSEQNILIQKDVLAQAKRDFKRAQKLYKTKSIEKQKFELAKLKLDTQTNKLNVLHEQRKEVKSAVKLAKIGLTDAQASQQKLLSISANINALKDGIKALKASKAQVKAMIDEMTLRSSVNGVTVEKIANEGEVIGSGMPIATLLDPHSLYLKIFIDTIENGKIKVGDRAVIFLDAYPDQPIEAKVVRIAQKAEFTPKEVSVRSDRIQRVFAVHLKPLKVDPLLKLGIPAIGVVSLDGKGLPSSLSTIPVL
ncbi:HlyD family secretion protein [Sulfurimonas autotrophica]|uniref:Secretion protein HlyD family protein n=1 Tax=Sulfurimonas autotrophica (strain ATCC BAA-671 / DSM 16294 / JCM 11897 / OK10) TaxID=563040 RepID=E0UTK1_SULAO|nr:HlyD family efflux transporter periplasmic adaptor subunit [Sulfurimonas autotrophica]ADN09366.1 secretion protein HlyD family protein [Sulfurimonas autotrophica DSM 16294]